MEKTHIFDNPRNVKWLLRVFYGLCVAAVLVDLTFLRHGTNIWDGAIGFYAIYGFVGCAALVLVAKEMRKWLMRREDHYDR